MIVIFQFLTDDFLQSSVNLITPTISPQFFRNFHSRARSQERIQNGLTVKAEEFDQTSGNLFWESRNSLLQPGPKRENIGDVPYCEVPFVIVVVVSRNFRFLQRLRRLLSNVSIVKLDIFNDQNA